jgi:transcription initiation factor TFIID subunit 6
MSFAETNKLHQILPSVLSILLGKTVGHAHSENPVAHLSTRVHASSLLSLLLSRYGASYPTMRPRMLRTLLRGLLEDKGFGTKYGAIVGLRRMGREAVRLALGSEGNLKGVGEAFERASVGLDEAELIERDRTVAELFVRVDMSLGIIFCLFFLS